MKAIEMHGYGGPEVLDFEDTPLPQPGEGEILVRIHAAGVNPIDWKIRTGMLKGRLDLPIPVIPGQDFSGVVEDVGKGVTLWKKGDEVFGRADLRRGSYAEYTVVKEGQVARKPAGIDHVHAAAIPVAGLTAWQALFDHGGLERGQRVLIHAAAGGVGSFAVQLAKWKGAYVIATASAENRDYLRDLGADEVIDYRTTAFEDVVHDVDLVLDLIGGDTQKRSWQTLRRGGILVSAVQPPTQEDADRYGVRGTIFSSKTIPAQLSQLAELIEAGTVRVIVDKVLPLSQAREAQELSQSGHVRGKIVLQAA